jgi:holo-[acyl-carrier protein] synthase
MQRGLRNRHNQSYYTADMRIIGHGIDLVETARIARLLEAHGERFLSRCFTVAEAAYAGDRRRGVEHLAGRFAAKEAIFKVLGTGWSGGVAWHEAEVVRQPGGAPAVVLHGRTAEVAAKLGITQWLISITHTQTHAMASAIGAG